jgi:hypothetical protein
LNQLSPSYGKSEEQNAIKGLNILYVRTRLLAERFVLGKNASLL